MKLTLALMVAISAALPAVALPATAGEYQRGYASSRRCTRSEYREEYVPGNQNSPGYVKSWSEEIEVPCSSTVSTIPGTPEPKTIDNIDNNDCSEGTLLGGLLGAGIATSSSRGKDRWWAIPAGAVGGAMLGCQIDGG